MDFKKGDLLIHLHNFYSPIIVMKDGLQERTDSDTSTFGGKTTHTNIRKSMGVSARSISMRQDYIYNEMDTIKCNLGQMSFEEFYANYIELVPEYAVGIKEHFDRQVGFVDMIREHNRGVKGENQLEMYKDIMSKFPLS